MPHVTYSVSMGDDTKDNTEDNLEDNYLIQSFKEDCKEYRGVFKAIALVEEDD